MTKFFEPIPATFVRDQFTGGCRIGMPTTIVMADDGAAVIVARELRTEAEARADIARKAVRS